MDAGEGASQGGRAEAPKGEESQNGYRAGDKEAREGGPEGETRQAYGEGGRAPPAGRATELAGRGVCAWEVGPLNHATHGAKP